MEKSACCNQRTISDSGYNQCGACGKVCSQAVYTHTQSYSHWTWGGVTTYSRFRRFCTILKKLQGVGPAILPEVIDHVRKRNPQTTTEIFSILRSMKGKMLPYEQCSTLLFYCTGNKPIVLTFQEKQIFFANFGSFTTCGSNMEKQGFTHIFG
jgi:hypothetical protein